MPEPGDSTTISPPPASLSPERSGTLPIVSTAPPKNEMIGQEPGPSSSSRRWEDEEDELPQRKGISAWVDKINPTMVLENSGSVARDHLANERTWLAYVRTSLAVASTGVALVQLFTISSQQPGTTAPLSGKLQRFARPLGAVIVVIGLTVLALGVNRYFRVQYALTINQFPPARKTVAFISTVLVAIVAIVFGVLVGVPRR